MGCEMVSVAFSGRGSSTWLTQTLPPNDLWAPCGHLSNSELLPMSRDLVGILPPHRSALLSSLCCSVHGDLPCSASLAPAGPKPSTIIEQGVSHRPTEWPPLLQPFLLLVPCPHPRDIAGFCTSISATTTDVPPQAQTINGGQWGPCHPSPAKWGVWCCENRQRA